MELLPKKYVCEKCGYLGDTSEHEGCDYLAWTTGEQLYIDQLERELALLKASPASVPEGFTMSEPTILPDGSGFGTMSFPLPKDHWIYKEREYEDGAIEPKDLPAPVLTHALRQQVIDAIRYAVRSATNCGKETDFDPDALVQNAVYALCGPYGSSAPTPPSTEDRECDAMICSDIPRAWEVWVRYIDRESEWKWYRTTEVAKFALETVKRIEGPPIVCKIVPLYALEETDETL